jgi:IS4 transposase
LKYRYVLFDKWFASVENLVFVNDVLKKKFVCPLKKNRKVALTKKDKDNGKYVSIATVDMGDCSSRLVYLEGYENTLKITKQVSKDGDDDESIYLYLVTNDIDLLTNKILEIYKRRWKIEEYHKSLKQNLKIEHSPTKVMTSQLNHIFLSVCGFIKLERLRLNYKMNHFAIKEKIYIEALKTAYQKVEELEYA